MSALYAMRYVGGASGGIGAVYVGKNVIVGIDAGNGHYHGTYTESGGRMKATITLSAPTGATLVTGKPMPAGSKIQLTADWPANFATGQQQIIVAGSPVNVTFEKIGDVP